MLATPIGRAIDQIARYLPWLMQTPLLFAALVDLFDLSTLFSPALGPSLPLSDILNRAWI